MMHRIMVLEVGGAKTSVTTLTPESLDRSTSGVRFDLIIVSGARASDLDDATRASLVSMMGHDTRITELVD